MHKKFLMGSLALLTAFIFVGCGQSAAPDTTASTSTSTSTATSGTADVASVTMQSGKMMTVNKDGGQAAMTQDATMSDGTKVMTDGSVTFASGVMMKMMEGSIIDMSGKLSTQGVWVLSLSDPGVTGFSFKGGKVTMTKGGKEIPLDNPVQLADGTVVEVDGSYISKDNKVLNFNDGDMMGADGMVKAAVTK